MSKPDTGDFPKTDKAIVEKTQAQVKVSKTEDLATKESASEHKKRRPPQNDDLSGRMLDRRFRVIERIGSGGMSQVYSAEHTLLQKMVAIKVLHRQQEFEEGIERFQQEAKAISSLDHPNIVKIYAFGASEDDHLYLAMDYLDGKSLDKVLEEEGALHWAKVQNLAKQITRGLEQAHDRGIVHRDLKPSNLIIQTDEDGNEVIKILDFGIAKLTSASGKQVKDLTQEGNTCGSPPYMSPEQCMGDPADARSDVYSLGCVLYELLCGQRPINGRTALEMMTNHVQQMPEFFASSCPELEIPSSLELIVRKCLAKEKDSRYQNMAELLHDLDQVGTCSDEEQVLESTFSRQVESTPGVKKTPSSKRGALIAIALSVLVLGGAGSAALILNQPQRELSALQKQVEDLNLADPNYRSKMGAIVPQLLSLYEKQNDMSSAQTCVHSLQKKAESLQGVERWVTLAQISSFYDQLGLKPEAKELAKKSVAGMYLLADKLYESDKNAAAELVLKQNLDICLKTNQPVNCSLAIMTRLFHIYMRQKRNAEAEQIARSAISIANQGSTMEKSLAHTNLGIALSQQNKVAAAEKAFATSLKLYLGENSIDTAFAKSVIAQLEKCAAAQGRSFNLEAFVASSNQ